MIQTQVHTTASTVKTTRHPYKTREGGATITIFVPYNCRNHCPFCINKEEYSHPEGFSAEKICKSIEMMNQITPYCDYVFTGGEPFANLDSLQMMLDKIPETHNVYINTTLPVFEFQTEDDIVNFTKHNKNKITCINVSRHMQHYVVESNDSLLGRLAVPFRINCVLYKNYPAQELVPYLERFHEKYPGVRFQITNGPTPATMGLLKEKKIDFGVVSGPLEKQEGVRLMPVRKIEDIFVAGRNFLEYTRQKQPLSVLEKVPLIMLDQDTSTRRYVQRFLEQRKVFVHPEFELATSDMIVQFALRNLGVGSVVRDFAKKELDSRELIELKLEEQLPQL